MLKNKDALVAGSRRVTDADGRQDSFFIHGSWHAKSDRSFDAISPRSEEQIGRVASASREDIDPSVAAARRALRRGRWSRMSPSERAEYLSRIATGIKKRQQKWAHARVEPNGMSRLSGTVYVKSTLMTRRPQFVALSRSTVLACSSSGLPRRRPRL